MSQLLQVATRSGQLPIVIGVAAPSHVSQGIPYDANGVAVDSVSAVNHYHQGLPFTANGRIRVSSGLPTYFGSGAAPFRPLGLAIQLTATNHYATGIPYSATSSLSVVNAT